MSARVVLEYYLNEFQTSATNLSDISFDNLSFLQEKEAVYNMKGQKVSKSYCDLKGREAIRITYQRVIEEYRYQNVTYPNIFTGLQKTVNYLDWTGEIAYSKKKQFYSFDLMPIYLADGTETIIGFSSQKQRQILKSERFNADDYLAAKNPILYSALYAAYHLEYNAYLRTGIATGFINAMNTETNSELKQMLDKEVFGYEPMTVKELIIMNLQ